MQLLKQGFKILFFIALLASAVLAIFVYRDDKIDNRVFSALPGSITPTPRIFVPGPLQKEFMDSPDGTITLTMEKQELENLVKYTFYTGSQSEATRQFIFAKDEPSNQTLQIPYNTWSPDNVYLFLKEATPQTDNYYVFFSNGETFSDNSNYLNVQTLFSQNISGYTITDVTGWAAPNLLIVNARETQGENRVSFWFDVPGRSFIQLSTYFY